jgi:hypothetical protein
VAEWPRHEVTIWDAPIQALAAQHADLDLDHVEPAGVLWGVVEFDFLEDAVRFGRCEGFVECAAECVDKLSSTTRTWSASG